MTMGYLTRAEVEQVAEAAAEKAVAKTMISFAIDPRSPLETQKDMIHLREWRLAMDRVRRKGILAAISFLFLGGLAMLLMALGIKLPFISS